MVGNINNYNIIFREIWQKVVEEIVQTSEYKIANNKISINFK